MAQLWAPVARRDPGSGLDGRAAHRQPAREGAQREHPHPLGPGSRRLGHARLGPLVDPGSLPLQTVHSVGRWLWFTVAVGGFLLVTGFAFAHDDPTPGLSVRGLVTIALAAAVVVLLTIRRTAGPGPLARALAEYAVVFLLAVLIATTGIPVDQPPATSGTTAHVAPDQRPALVKTIDGFWDWLREWRQWADKQTDRHAQAATGPAATLSSSTRRWL